MHRWCQEPRPCTQWSKCTKTQRKRALAIEPAAAAIAGASELINRRIHDTQQLNEEEKKEKEQYKLLKKSLKALQERANTTFKSTAQPETDLQEEEKKCSDQLAKNYSVSGDENNEEVADGDPYPQGLISDDESNDTNSDFNQVDQSYI